MQKIPLSREIAFVNQNARDDMGKLLDRNYGRGRFTIYNPLIKPYQITFDLEYGGIQNTVIKELRYTWNAGAATDQKYFAVKPTGEKVLIHHFSQGEYGNPPVEHVIPIPGVQASKIILESANAWGDFPDWFEVYGDFQIVEQVLPKLPAKTVDQLFGGVAKSWDLADHLYPEKIPLFMDTGITRYRWYIDYNMVRTDGKITLNGFYRELDNIKLLESKGVRIQLCYMDVPYYPFTGDRLNPDTYLQLAQDMTEIAKIFAANSIKADGELLNEPNMWYGANPQLQWMNGYELACMCSVAYDGHKGKYPGVGWKGTGAQGKFSNGGLASSDPDIWYQMTEWSIKNRGYKSNGEIDYPFDVYSYHLYSSLGGQRAGIKGGIPPEYGMLAQMANINTYRKKKARDIEVRIGEWGWDTAPDSELNSPAYGSYDRFQVNGMWVARSILCKAAMEVDAASHFMTTIQHLGTDDTNGTIFWSMGLIAQESWGTQDSNGVTTGLQMHRVMAGTYFKQLHDLLTGYTFTENLSSYPLMVLKFTKGDSQIYAVWTRETMDIPDDNQRPQFTEVVSSYSLSLPGKLMRFNEAGNSMISEDFAGGTVTANSKPAFVVVGSVEDTFLKKGYWVIERKRLYFKVYKTSTGHKVETSTSYEWYKKAP